MNTTTFNQLVKNISCDTGDDLSVIGFVAKHENYEINFYGNEDEGFVLRVEDFGFTENGVWNQLNPTDEQMSVMTKILSDKKEELFENVVEDEFEEEFDGDYYSYYGVKQSDFY